MKINTRELIGPALDWAVAKCEGKNIVLDPMGFRSEAPNSPQAGFWVWPKDGPYQIVGREFSPSTNWAQGGPIIEREWISIAAHKDGWRTIKFFEGGGCVYNKGSTPLIAAMRCYVASKLGDEVDAPEELM